VAVGYIFELGEEVLGILAGGAGLAEARNLLAAGHGDVKIEVDGVSQEPGDRNLEVGSLARLEELEVGKTQNLEIVGHLVDF